jgi:hypothetical protein
VNDAVIHEFNENEVTIEQQVEETWAKLEAFETKLLRPE